MSSIAVSFKRRYSKMQEYLQLIVGFAGGIGAAFGLFFKSRYNFLQKKLEVESDHETQFTRVLVDEQRALRQELAAERTARMQSEGTHHADAHELNTKIQKLEIDVYAGKQREEVLIKLNTEQAATIEKQTITIEKQSAELVDLAARNEKLQVENRGYLQKFIAEVELGSDKDIK